MTATGQSLYDKLGADVGITKAVDEFYNRVVTDPDLAQFFSGVDMASLRRHQVAMLSVATGGPAQYTGRDMETAHAGLGITDAHFDRVVEHLAGTLTHLAVDDETISEVAAALTPLRPAIVSA
jgi:hemoglobin